jgi:DNA-binding MarR family transcriptional regulator
MSGNRPEASAGAGELGTRWLTEQEQSTWRSLIAVAMWLPLALDTQLRRDAEISHFEYAVLAHLSMSPDRTMRISDLACLANGTLPRLSKVIDRFEARGWVTRQPCPSDGRYTMATLTDQGWETVTAAAPGHVEQVRRLIFDQLTATQVRQLDAIAAKLAAAVRPDRTGSWPRA